MLYLTKDPAAALPNDWRPLGGGSGGPGIPGACNLERTFATIIAPIPPGGWVAPYAAPWLDVHQTDGARMSIEAVFNVLFSGPDVLTIGPLLNGSFLHDLDGNRGWCAQDATLSDWYRVEASFELMKSASEVILTRSQVTMRAMSATLGQTAVAQQKDGGHFAFPLPGGTIPVTLLIDFTQPGSHGTLQYISFKCTLPPTDLVFVP
jgi:hypothetical protein